MARKKKWRDAHTGSRVVPSGHSLRLKKKPYRKEFRRSSEKPEVLSGVHPGQTDKEMARFSRAGSLGHTYNKDKEQGRKHTSEEWHSRQNEGPGFRKGNVRRSYWDTHDKTTYEDVGSYKKNVSPITYGGVSDKNTPKNKTVTSYEPEGVKVRSKSTEEKKSLSGPKKDIDKILKNRKKKRLASQKDKSDKLSYKSLYGDML